MKKKRAKTKKVVINTCFGGFGLSEDAITWLRFAGWKGKEFPEAIPRDSPLLIKCVETLGSEEASGIYSDLKIVRIPIDVKFIIQEYDGIEWVAEKHRTWR